MSHFESLNGIFAIEDMAGKKFLTKTSLCVAGTYRDLKLKKVQVQLSVFADVSCKITSLRLKSTFKKVFYDFFALFRGFLEHNVGTTTRGRREAEILAAAPLSSSSMAGVPN